MASVEHLNALLIQIGQLTHAISQQQQQQHGGTETHRTRKLIDAKHMRLQDFSGELDKYDDCAFSFKRVLRSFSVGAFDLLEKVDKEVGDFDEAVFSNQNDLEDVAKYSAELYDIICSSCTGEALSIVQTVADFQGFSAWHKLRKKFNPRTMARAIRLVGQVTNPAKIKELKDVKAEIAKWEERVKVLQKEFKEEFSDIVKVGIITSILPQSVQEHVYTSMGDTVNYANIMEDPRGYLEQGFDDARPCSHGYWLCGRASTTPRRKAVRGGRVRG